MSAEEYRNALIARGFIYRPDSNQWTGPFNIMLTGFLNHDQRPFADSARKESIAVVDEKLRAGREGARPRSSGGPGPGLI